MSRAHARRIGARLTRPVALSLLVVAGGLGLAGCDTLSSINPFDKAEKYKPEIVADVPAEQIYNQGLARLESSDHEGAAKKFKDLDKLYPNSEWSRKGLLMTAYAHYEGRQYEEAINASRRYLQAHASSKDAAYAQYLLAMSNYNQIPDVSRDQERSQKALVAFTELVQRYPTSEYVPDARAKIAVARDQLAAREMEVGRYYLEQRNYTAAINRFRTVVGTYQTTRHTEEALMRLTEAYLALGIANEAQTAAAVLGHNFPDSQWYKDAYTLLRSGGLEPREEAGSWISRAFKGMTRTVGLGG